MRKFQVTKIMLQLLIENGTIFVWFCYKGFVYHIVIAA